MGSDAHNLDMLGYSLNIVDAYDVDTLIKALKKKKARFIKNYVNPEVMMKWIRTRFELSYEDVLNYIDNNYSPPKAWLSKRMLNRFLFSESWFAKNLWFILGQFGINMAKMYGILRILSYM